MMGVMAATDAGAAAPKLGHRPGLDGLRGLAVALVVAYHAFPDAVPGGHVGVDVFFVLSGFLITTLLLEEHGRDGRISLGGFYLRRSLRLFPALAVYIVATGVYAYLTYDWLFADHLAWAPFVYLTNVMLAFDFGTVAQGHTWTLAMEEQFYAVWPLLLVGLLRRRRPVVVAFTAAAAAASVTTMVVLAAHGASTARLIVGPDTRAMPLLVGCLLAELWVWRQVRWPGLRVAGVLALLALVATAWKPPTLIHGGYVVVAVAAAVLIVAVVESPLIASIFALRPLMRLGVLSYALYLWHPFMLTLVGDDPLERVLAVGAAYAIAVVSMAFVERPALSLKGRLSRRLMDRVPRDAVAARDGEHRRLAHAARL